MDVAAMPPPFGLRTAVLKPLVWHLAAAVSFERTKHILNERVELGRMTSSMVSMVLH